MRRILPILHLAIYLGPLLFAGGLLLALIAQFAGFSDTALHWLLFLGLSTSASGLIIWGCHGIRRRGRRPGFVLMSLCGSSYFLIHLLNRWSDYRWAQLNTMDFGAVSATLPYLQSRILLLIGVLLVSAAIGLLHPLPADSNRLWPPGRSRS